MNPKKDYNKHLVMSTLNVKVRRDVTVLTLGADGRHAEERGVSEKEVRLYDGHLLGELVLLQLKTTKLHLQLLRITLLR